MEGTTLGKTLALLAPIAWSFAIIMFRVTGLKVPPLALNLFKSILAVLLFTATILLLGGEPNALKRGPQD